MGVSANNSSSSFDDQRTPTKTIAIIGAGPAGLVALKSVLADSNFEAGKWNVVVYEQKAEVGGVWIPDDSGLEGTGVDGISVHKEHAATNTPGTPLYHSLTTNLPHPLMAFSDLYFPPETPLFPKASYVLEYLRSYSNKHGLREHIHFKTRVDSVIWIPDSPGRPTEEVKPGGHADRTQFPGRWELCTKSMTTGKESISFADLLVVANGHYARPRYPSTPGLESWQSAPLSAQRITLIPKAIHAIYYRSPHTLFDPGAKVLVVGNGPSGRDISRELAELGSCEVLWSYTDGESSRTPVGKGSLRSCGRIAAYEDPQNGAVVFEDGTREDGVSGVVLCTGYQYSYPFFHDPQVLRRDNAVSDEAHQVMLRIGYPPRTIPVPTGPPLCNTTYGIFPLGRHLWPLWAHEDGTPTDNDVQTRVHNHPVRAHPAQLVFPSLPQRVSPLPLAEIQAQAALAAFAHPTVFASCIPKLQQEVHDRIRELLGELRDSPRERDVEDSEVCKEDELSSEDSETTKKVLKGFHTINDPMGQFNYRDDMCALIDTLTILGNATRPQSSHSTATTTTTTTSDSESDSDFEGSLLTRPSHRTFYLYKDILRATWVAMERSGEADAFVRGVGVKSRDAGDLEGEKREWEALMWRVLEKAGVDVRSISSYQEHGV